MVDVGEGFRGESVFRVAITAENGRFLRRGEGARGRCGLSAALKGNAGRVGGGRGVRSGKVDFRLASHEGELHFAGRSTWVPIDGVRMEVSVIVVALVVQRLDIEVRDHGARDGGRGL